MCRGVSLICHLLSTPDTFVEVFGKVAVKWSSLLDQLTYKKWPLGRNCKERKFHINVKPSKIDKDDGQHWEHTSKASSMIGLIISKLSSGMNHIYSKNSEASGEMKTAALLTLINELERARENGAMLSP